MSERERREIKQRNREKQERGRERSLFPGEIERVGGRHNGFGGKKWSRTAVLLRRTNADDNRLDRLLCILY